VEEIVLKVNDKGTEKMVKKLVIYGNHRYNTIKSSYAEVAVNLNNSIKTETGITDNKELVKYCTQNREDSLVKSRNIAWAEYISFNNMVTSMSLPYCRTVHKAQGDTVDNVFIDGADLLKLYARNLEEYLSLFYTAVSRAKHIVYINN